MFGGGFKMEEKTLLVFSIILFCFGVSMLYLIYSTTDVSEVKDMRVHMGETVKVYGEVVRVNVRDGVTFIDIKREQIVQIVFFEEMDLGLYSDVEIIGEVAKGMHGYELLGREIKKIK